jgi:hypothetical protein
MQECRNARMQKYKNGRIKNGRMWISGIHD